MLSFLSTFYKGIPTTIKQFLQRCLLIFIIWKVLYHLVLYPVRIPDNFLTTKTAYLTGNIYFQIFNNMQPSYITDKDKTTIFFNNKHGIAIGHGCNGLELFILYIGLLLSFPIKNIKKVIGYIIIGCISIFILNIIRCVALCYFNIHHTNWFNFAHHYFFQLTVYAFIFFLWHKYLKLNDKPKEQ